MQVENIISFYEKVHGKKYGQHHIVMAVDGVQENRTNTTSLLVFAIKFGGCRCVLPLAILKSHPGKEVERDYVLSRVIEDLK